MSHHHNVQCFIKVTDIFDSYMRPCTPHFVLGTAPSIVLGRHYYATSSIRRSCFGIVHMFVLGLGITNTTHGEEPWALLRQLMALYYRHLVLHDGFGSKPAFIPSKRIVNT